MQQITQLTDDAKQKATVILDDGSSITINIEYKPLQLGWFITELSYKTFDLQGFRIVTSPNLLRQFKNLIPFGLACFVQQNDEATQQQDFLSGRATLFVLSAQEVVDYEAILSG